MNDAVLHANMLGSYLRDRRGRLDPAAFGLSRTRRRTPGLRREEVAQRANISATWYTWLEQGRGGAPSADVLNRIATALMLTEVEREHLFLLGLGHPPEAHYRPGAGVTPRLQRILDRIEPAPALIRTATWDVIAWNRAVRLVLADYAAMVPGERNVLRFIFLDPRGRAAQYDWDSVARAVVSSFRVDVARAGATGEVGAIVDELCRGSPDFARLWGEGGLHPFNIENIKEIRHPELGVLRFEHSTFAVDGRPDLSMVIYNPVDAADTARLATLLASDGAARA